MMTNAAHTARSQNRTDAHQRFRKLSNAAQHSIEVYGEKVNKLADSHKARHGVLDALEEETGNPHASEAIGYLLALDVKIAYR